MSEEKQYIICPSCETQIELDKVLTAKADKIEIALKKKYDTQLQKEREVLKADLESKIKITKQELLQRKTEEISEIKKQIEGETARSFQLELTKAQQQAKGALKRAEDAEKRELNLLARQNDLDQKEKNINLHIQREVLAGKKKIFEETRDALQTEYQFEIAEKDKQLSDMKKKVEEMQKKFDQGSQQTQGEIGEIVVENMLREEFASDMIQEIKKGANGADILQEVITGKGDLCGRILWETKRAQSWSDGWITKLKDDQQKAKADIAVIVTQCMPSGPKYFHIIDNNVWVTDFSHVLSLALGLRVQLTGYWHIRRSTEGKNKKLEILFGYLTGSEFSNRVRAIVEAFSQLQDELQKEKRAYQNIWARREKQLLKVIENTSGMHGDLKGIIGASLPELQILELPNSEDHLIGKSEEEESPF